MHTKKKMWRAHKISKRSLASPYFGIAKETEMKQIHADHGSGSSFSAHAMENVYGVGLFRLLSLKVAHELDDGAQRRNIVVLNGKILRLIVK